MKSLPFDSVMTKKQYKYGFLIDFLFLALLFSPTVQAVDFPEKRSDAFRPITVIVKRPPEFEIVFDVRYESDGTSCNGFNLYTWMNSGHGESRAVFDKLFTEPSGTDEFTRELPVNQYAPGRCGWSPTSLRIYAVNKNYPPKKGQYPTVQQLAIGDFGVHSVEFTVQCKYLPTPQNREKNRNIYCSQPRDEFKPRALLPEDAIVKVGISWKEGILP